MTAAFVQAAVAITSLVICACSHRVDGSAVTVPGLKFSRAQYEGVAPLLPRQDVSACDVGGPGNYPLLAAHLGDLGDDGVLDVAVTRYSAPAPYGLAEWSRTYAVDVSVEAPVLRPREAPWGGVVALADADGDGWTDVLTEEAPWYADGAGGFDRGSDWPTRLHDAPSVDVGLFVPGETTISTQREACSVGHQVTVLAHAGGRLHVDRSERLPKTAEAVDVQEVRGAVFADYRAVSFAGFACPSGSGVPNLFFAQPAGAWKIDREGDYCGSDMGVLFLHDTVYRTCDPDVLLRRRGRDGIWRPEDNPFRVSTARGGSLARPWGIARVVAGGLEIVVVAHGPDDGCRRDFIRGELSNVTAYAVVGGAWTQLDLGDLTSDRANWRWVETRVLGGAAYVAVGTIGNDPLGGSVGGGLPQVYVWRGP